MEPRTYRATTMAQALAEVKKDLGRDAVILHTRSFRRGGLLGIGGRPMWEVTASTHINVPQHLPAGSYVSVQEVSQAPAAAATASRPETLSQVLCERIVELQKMVARLLSRSGPASKAPDLPAGLAAARDLLLRQDVSEPMADALIGDVRQRLTPGELDDPPAVRHRLGELIAERIPIPAAETPYDGQRPRVMVLIGPTGVGKTTTIAKLAARFKLQARRKVGLVTIDTYRIAAVDQLKTFAQILEVPLRTVLTPSELGAAIDEMSGMDVLLVDTAGRSPADKPRLRQMQAFLEVARPDEVHLVVAATASRTCADRALGSFMPLGANRVIISKLDEAATFGVVLEVASSSTAALSYVTTGQEVPDDIAPADPQYLAGLIVGEGGHDG